MFRMSNIWWFIAGYWICALTFQYSSTEGLLFENNGLLFSAVGSLMWVILWGIGYYITTTFKIVRKDPSSPSLLSNVDINRPRNPPQPSKVIPPAPDTRG